MKSISVVHIHTSYKFVFTSLIFKGELFNSKNIIIQNKSPYKGKFKDDAVLFTKNKSDIKKIIEICSKADLVVFYELDHTKSRIALALPVDVKIAWRFFGYELYGRARDRFLSEKTIKVLRKDENELDKIKTTIRIFYSKTINGKSDKLFYRALNRINFMLISSKEEYNFLNKYWTNLPEFIHIPIWPVKTDLLNRKKRVDKPVIIVGNNKNHYNNHLDVIDIIDKYATKKHYRFALLFSYGSESNYSESVRNAVKNKSYFELMENFMSFEEYKAFYIKVSALVINSYRQMAGNNIFTAIENGVKIYLNTKNIFYTWLTNEGFQIFTIENFVEDIINSNLLLSNETAKYNFQQLKKLAEKYTIDSFQETIYSKISD